MTPEERPHVLSFGGVDHNCRTLLELGCSYVLMQDKALVTPYQTGTAHQLILCDYEDVALCVALARVLHARQPFRYVLCLSEFPQRAAAAIAADLGLPTNCESFAIEHTRDKLRFRDLLSAQGVPNVPYRRIGSAAAAEDFRQQVGGRVVLKPVSGAGSEGVHYADSAEAVAQAYAHAAGVGREGVIAEKYVGGDEYSVETISKSGVHELIALTRKSITGFPHFVEVGHVQPWAMGARRQEVERLVFQALDAVRHRTGPAHTEVKVEADGVHIIESQLRPGGDQLWEITRLTTGMDAARETACCLMGLPAPERRPEHACVAIRFFQLPPTTLTREAILAGFAPHPDVIRTVIDKLGTEAVALTHSWQRSGYLMVHGGTAEDAQRLAESEAARLVAHMDSLQGHA
ncbi:ATP-grasp domain-containing protein [Ramlibacter sp.]|uniref:ATP-grasp domain-containing protein n=1 Tax=Ramlibacter sp. TaxID=1917967 RepID=UPI0017AE1FB8|nr:ATP-grasp domain-containing protein [Ramlibacter sp.]MBA2673438.1 ATP-grasp domain-containing protein [Ramlibacter sp.]